MTKILTIGLGELLKRPSKSERFRKLVARIEISGDRQQAAIDLLLKRMPEAELDQLLSDLEGN